MKYPFFTLAVFSLIIINSAWAIVKFDTQNIKDDFENIIKEDELTQLFFERLSCSELTYVIRYAAVDAGIDAHFFSDGEKFYITLKKDGAYPLQANFVHEAVHALQFEAGRLGFYKNRKGEWKSHNIDLWDEAEAFLTMLHVVKKYYRNILSLKRNNTFMHELNKQYELYGMEEVVNWLAKYYPKLSKVQKNNPPLGQGLLKGAKFIYMPYKTDSDEINKYLAVLNNN